MNILDFKKNEQKISMVTCYDYYTARILNQTDIDSILVGDSLAMVMHGYPSTIPANMDLMELHCQAVVKGAPNKFIIGDMPFLSYRKDFASNMKNIERLVKTGVAAIKLEGASGNLELISHIEQSGIPVMGHIGLTPQSINKLGGHRVQGKDEQAANNLIQQAIQLEQAGCFSLVLECIPALIAKEITDQLSIPTIGIGAGPDTDGQVLVLQDMLGMDNSFSPRFLRKYLNGEELIKTAINRYHQDVLSKEFPLSQGVLLMKLLTSIPQWQEVFSQIAQQSIGLVPTMGALHSAHLSLVEKAIKENEITVVSIFVNPTQFNNSQDLKNYPRPFERDRELLGKLNVDYLFHPPFEELYPDNYRYRVSENELSRILCGAHRPGHFDGVLSVVMKLFNIIRPTRAYFGEKDYQQLMLIKEMVKAFFMPLEIISCPTIREEDGLAMSSRNILLDQRSRQLAPHFYRLLNSSSSCSEIKKQLTDLGFEIDYIEELFDRRFGAVTLNNVRLIDNVQI